MLGYSYQVTPKGIDVVIADLYMAVDNKTHHATVCDNIHYPGRDFMNLPLDKLGPQHFTESYLIQRSK